MGCQGSKQKAEQTLAVRYAKAGLQQPFSQDYENNFEMELF